MQFYQELNRSGSFRCFPHASLPLASEKTLKDLKRSQGRWGEWICLTGPSGLHKNSPKGLNISSIGIFYQIKYPEIQIILRPQSVITVWKLIIFTEDEFVTFLQWHIYIAFIWLISIFLWFYCFIYLILFSNFLLFNVWYNLLWGRRLIGISGSLIWSKTLMELMFNRCGKFRWSLEGPVSQIHSPHLFVGAPGIFSDLLRSVQMLKGEWGAKCNGKLPHLLNP